MKEAEKGDDGEEGQAAHEDGEGQEQKEGECERRSKRNRGREWDQNARVNKERMWGFLICELWVQVEVGKQARWEATQQESRLEGRSRGRKGKGRSNVWRKQVRKG